MKQKRKSRARGEEDDISQQFYAARAGTENVIIITSLVFFPRVSARCAGTSQQRSCTLKLEQCEPLLCIKHEHSWELNHGIWNCHTRLFKRFFWKINTQHQLLTYMHSPCPRRVMEHHIAARSAVRECPRHPHSTDQDACQAPRHSGTTGVLRNPVMFLRAGGDSLWPYMPSCKQPTHKHGHKFIVWKVKHHLVHSNTTYNTPLIKESVLVFCLLYTLLSFPPTVLTLLFSIQWYDFNTETVIVGFGLLMHYHWEYQHWKTYFKSNFMQVLQIFILQRKIKTRGHLYSFKVDFILLLAWSDRRIRQTDPFDTALTASRTAKPVIFMPT